MRLRAGPPRDGGRGVHGGPGRTVELHDALVVRFEGGAIASVGGASLPLGSFGNQHQLAIRITGRRGQVLLDMATPRVARSMGGDDVEVAAVRRGRALVVRPRHGPDGRPRPRAARRTIRRRPRSGRVSSRSSTAMYRSAASGRIEPDQPGLTPAGGSVTSGAIGTRTPARTTSTGTSRWRASRIVARRVDQLEPALLQAQDRDVGLRPDGQRCRAGRPSRASPPARWWPSRGRRRADSPRSRNFDIVVARSWTGPATLKRWRSVLIVSGRKPSASAASAIAPGEAAGAMADVEPDAPRASLSGGRHDAPVVGQDRARAPAGERMRDDVARPEPVERPPRCRTACRRCGP